MIQKRLTHFFEFGPFRFAPEQPLLLRGGVPVSLPLKSYDVLHVLVRNCGYVVTKDELMNEVWPDQAVEESNLTQNISVLRKALGESPRQPSYIETVPRRGYRFRAGVREVRDENGDLLEVLQARQGADQTSDARGADETAQTGGVEEQSLTSLPHDDETPGNADARTEEPPDVVNSSQLNSTSVVGRSVVRRAARVGYQKALMTALPVVLVALIFFAAHLYWPTVRLVPRPSTSPAAQQSMKLLRLTTEGKVVLTGISPDGRYVAYVTKSAGRQSLWLRQASAANGIEIIPPADLRYRGVTFTPDNSSIYYVASARDDTFGSLYRVPLLGGAAVRLIEHVDGPVTISPDGHSLAFVRVDPAQRKRVLLKANADGSGERELISMRLPDYLSIEGPSWSPDGELIAYAAGSLAPDFHCTVRAIRVADNVEISITPQSWFLVGQVAWLRDGSGLVVNAEEQTYGSTQLWRVSYPGGEARRITNDLTDYLGVSLARDADVLVTVQAWGTSNLWVAPEGDADGAWQVTTGLDDGYFGLSLSPDGTIYYTSSAGGSQDIWSTKPDGSIRRQLTSDPRTDHQPSASPDGRFVAFTSDRTGSFHIWRMDADGANPVQLTHGGGVEFAPYFTPDSRWVTFTSTEGGKTSLWKVAVDGSEAVKLSDLVLAAPAVSPDGKLIACWYRDDSNGSRRKLTIVSFAGGELLKEFEATAPDLSFNTSNPIRWTRNGRALTYFTDLGDGSGVWVQPFVGGRPTRVVSLRNERIFNFDESRDGKQAVYARGVEAADAVLMSDLP